MSSTLNRQNRLAFWCQKVLPLVYDESLSYYELLCKVVKHLNDNTDAINVLIEFFNSYAAEVKKVIEEMLEDGELDPVIASVLGALIASPYDESEHYILFDYCIYNSKLYRANGATTGEFDPEKWDEKVLGDDISVLENRVYGLNAGHVAYNDEAEYNDNTVGKELQDLSDAIDTTELNIAPLYDTTATYNKGDYVTRVADGKVYRCTGTTTGSWDGTKWTEVNVANDLKGAINLLGNRRFVFIGDSYGINNDRWIGKTIDILGLTANDNAFNISLASTGFVGDPEQSGDLTWKTLLTNNIANITNKNTITDIIVCGGTNDISATYVDLYNAIRDFKTYALSQMPNAKISIGFIGRKNTGANNQAYGNCAGYYQELATKFGMAYIENSECCWGYKTNYTDTWHPNSNGYALIAACIANYILTGSGTAMSAFHTFAPTKSGLTEDSTTTFGNGMMSQIASNGIYTIGETDVNAIIFPAKTITCNDSWQELLTIPNAIVAGNGWAIAGGSIGIYDSVNGNYPSIPCLFRYYDNKIWVKMPWKGYAGTTDFSCTSTQIKFAIPMLVMPMKGN